MTSHNVSFLALSGGHGTSMQLGQVREAVAINMENFNHVVVNQDQTLTVGGGSRFGDIYPVAHAAGRELSMSFCNSHVANESKLITMQLKQLLAIALALVPLEQSWAADMVGFRESMAYQPMHCLVFA